MGHVGVGLLDGGLVLGALGLVAARCAVLGAVLCAVGGTRPFRVHFRDPSFTNLQGTSVMSEGGMVADVIVAIASIDPVMGGVDR